MSPDDRLDALDWVANAIVQSISELGRVSLSEAERIYRDSTIPRCVTELPEQVLHEPAGFWAEAALEQELTRHHVQSRRLKRLKISARTDSKVPRLSQRQP